MNRHTVAPYCSSNLAIASCPHLAATCSAVCVELFTRVISAPCCSSSSTTSVAPFSVAANSAVQQPPINASTLAPLTNKCCVIVALALQAALHSHKQINSLMLQFYFLSCRCKCNGKKYKK